MTKEDVTKVKALHHGEHGVHEMLGSLDVNQIRWGNCPTAEKVLSSFSDGSFAKLDIDFGINGEFFTILFLLVDGIYPRIAHFLQTILLSTTKIDQFFTSQQEAMSKDIEHAFGVLEKKYHSLVYPIELFNVEYMYYVS